MRAFIIAAALLAFNVQFDVVSAQAPAQAPAKAPAAAGHYSTADTDIGTLIDDPAAHAIVDKHLPGLLSDPQIDQARAMTLKAIQSYAADRVPDKALADIDVELAKLPVKKK